MGKQVRNGTFLCLRNTRLDTKQFGPVVRALDSHFCGSGSNPDQNRFYKAYEEHDFCLYLIPKRMQSTYIYTPVCTFELYVYHRDGFIVLNQVLLIEL